MAEVRRTGRERCAGYSFRDIYTAQNGDKPSVRTHINIFFLMVILKFRPHLNTLSAQINLEYNLRLHKMEMLGAQKFTNNTEPVNAFESKVERNHSFFHFLLQRLFELNKLTQLKLNQSESFLLFYFLLNISIPASC